jgi:undecaprenyl-diphosphatase
MYCGFNKDKIACFCGIALLTVLVSGSWAIHLQPIEQLDRMIPEWFATSRSVGLDQFFMYVTWAGSNVILLPLILAQALILIFRKNIRDALFLIGACIGGSLLNSAAKLVIMRPRPNLFPVLIDLPAGFSFPSSHAVQITAFVLAELLLLKASTRARWFFLFNVAGGILIVLVCLSRLYLQVHYPTDVVAGFLTSLFWVAALAALILSDRHNLTTSTLGCCVVKGKQQ